MPCQQLLDECFRLNLPFIISEAFRSQHDQDLAYAEGRTAPGPIVTWVRHSKHTDRLAFDALPQNYPKMTSAQVRAYLAEIAELAKKYGIVRPASTLAKGDYGHFEVDSAHPLIAFPKPEADQKSEAVKQIARLSGNVKERAIARYVKLYGEYPSLR